ncbi:ferredoxin C 1, chloroplastic [Aristolochia californica]|uniref:ferredoxin C 1, chloroplastic n=1 Tax=Aristolochia californica TaxID=171875 RepID=UPI0035D5CF83
MASLQLLTPSALYYHRHRPHAKSSTLQVFVRSPPTLIRRRGSSLIRAYKVTIEHEGERTEMEVEPDETILEKALETGMSIPHDCKLGVCMTCPARLLTGSVDQSDGMLSDDVVARGYALLCASYPRADCEIQTIPEEELLSLQLATAND